MKTQQKMLNRDGFGPKDYRAFLEYKPLQLKQNRTKGPSLIQTLIYIITKLIKKYKTNMKIMKSNYSKNLKTRSRIKKVDKTISSFFPLIYDKCISGTKNKDNTVILVFICYI